MIVKDNLDIVVVSKAFVLKACSMIKNKILRKPNTQPIGKKKEIKISR